MNKILLLFLLALVACDKEGVHPNLVGSWEPTARSFQAGSWESIPTVSRSKVVFTREGLLSGFGMGCGCLTAYKYKQQGSFLDITYGGTPCPTLIACQPEPPTEIVSLTRQELILKRGQYQTRYERR
ncbi:hypothetical protein ACFSUS_26870 [Spirosoma soli]|uniref:META domain-containing protein n=1 Tax=Spirosoma soli TaxID=1770529 RepID=A0ABW5MCQ0_9BACT